MPTSWDVHAGVIIATNVVRIMARKDAARHLLSESKRNVNPTIYPICSSDRRFVGASFETEIK
jgi:hypothetical protein